MSNSRFELQYVVITSEDISKFEEDQSSRDSSRFISHYGTHAGRMNCNLPVNTVISKKQHKSSEKRVIKDQEAEQKSSAINAITP